MPMRKVLERNGAALIRSRSRADSETANILRGEGRRASFFPSKFSSANSFPFSFIVAFPPLDDARIILG